MKEYIEKAAVKDEILSWAVCINHPELLSKEDTMHCIDNMPSANVAEEVIKPVPGYEGYYEVDNLGRVFSVDRIIQVNDNGRIYDKPIHGALLKQTNHSQGYKTVALTKNGKTKQEYVHRIVASAFIPNPDNFSVVNHKDEDKTNNFVDNLEWCTVSYNNTYGEKTKKQAEKIRGIPHKEDHKEKNIKLFEGVL